MKKYVTESAYAAPRASASTADGPSTYQPPINYQPPLKPKSWNVAYLQVLTGKSPVIASVILCKMRNAPKNLTKLIAANAIAALLTHVLQRVAALSRRCSQARHRPSFLGESEQQPCNNTHAPHQHQQRQQPPSWALLPVDVLAMLVQQLGDGEGGGAAIARLRLVCPAWSSAVDAVLEDLELLQFPGVWGWGTGAGRRG